MTTATPKKSARRRETTTAPRPLTPGALALVPSDAEVLRPGSAPVRLGPGRRVPGTRYRIVRWLGEGGMGVIYEAEHMDVQRKVALKVLREEAGESVGAAAELRREARTASQIGSDYIVEVFDLGTLPDGRIFVALELVEGRDLFDEVTNGPMALERLIPILRQMCKGLGAAHAAEVIHRDIKPENILLGRRNGRSDAVKVVDFGVARVLGAARIEQHAVGTPVYMAPECWTGEPTDHRVDIYALGVTAYELLAGAPPCDGDARDVMLFHLETDPAPLAKARPGLAVPLELEDLIRKCMAKRPEERFTDMADLEAALCEVQVKIGLETVWDDLPLPDVDEERRDHLLRNMPSPDIVSVGRGRQRWWIGAALGAVVALGGVGALGLLSDDEVSAEHTTVVTELANAARAAAARAYYVYPPAASDEETAYRKVLELEALEGDKGHGTALGLRGEFAETLVRLGDRYWARDGGRVFAVDYYAQALVFEAKNPRANERSPLSLAEIAELRRKASTLEFTADERRAVAPLVILAADNEDEALSNLEAYFAEDRAESLSRDASVERLLRSSGRAPKVGRRRAARPQAEPKPAPPESEAPQVPREVAPEPSEAEPELDSEATAAPKQPFDSPKPANDVEGASALVKQARTAAHAGQKKKAESLYHRALAKNGRSGAALIGLSNIYFERANYYRAMEYATKAVKRSPKSSGYRILLGDAYFKLLRYNDARKQYEWAKRLGHSAAERRLAKVDKKLGR